MSKWSQSLFDSEAINTDCIGCNWLPMYTQPGFKAAKNQGGNLSSQSRTLGYMEQSHHILNAAAMNMVTNFNNHSLGPTTSAIKGIRDLLANEARFDASRAQDNKEDDCKENQGHREGNILRKKATGESDENHKQCSTEKSSLKYSSNTADVVLGNIQSHGLSNSSGICKTTIQKVAPTDKLWDGCLMLNSSVTVSSVAFFKSGEKMLDVKWSEAIEVKGKVKLDDFEKYIQDLPRSRNRRLMVVSLCWKEGSSKLALAGMKKVAKRYQECQRVGFAELSPSIVLYVCPHSETIITILAKHGFFKGKTAVEENKDSMIGCVVWRRKQINSNPVETKSERCTNEVPVPIWSPIHLPSESLELPGRNRTALDAKQKDIIEMDKKLSESPLGAVRNLPTNYSVLASQFTPGILPSVPGRSETSHPDPGNQQVSMEHTSKLESHVDKSREEEQQDLKSKMQGHVPVLPPDVTKQSLPTVNLPEFSYGSSCVNVSQAVANRALDSLMVNKNLPDKGFRHMDSSLPLTMVPPLNSSQTSQKRTLENLSHQGLSSDHEPQNMPSQKKVCRPCNFPMPPLAIEGQSRPMRMPYGTPVAPRAPNLFADYNDMQERCPPYANPRKQSIHVTNHSSNFPIISSEHRLIRPVQPAPAQNPFSSSAYTAANRPPIFTPSLHFTFHPFSGVPAFPQRHSQPRPSNFYNNPNGPSSSMQINGNQSFRSNSCLVNGMMPINHQVWRGWMPTMPNRNGM
ncbi:hypothetical protein RIF29_09752 [Crotalaria pallida]|uniref:Spen paralogue and orthologue SPOC C-terminal domain-containing protein n=1 Tax=Crotalaria pallida TaxID=3830 RepID=A0AAN9FYC7_CROPI